MSETNVSLRFDEPIEGPVTAPLSGEAVSRSTSNSPASAVTKSPSDADLKHGGFKPGMQIGTYHLISKLGEGGMGIVFKARHTKLDKTVAIKLLPTAFLTHPSTLARFELEMKVVGRLEHPNIVAAYDAGEEHGTHYLVMEFVEGTDLQRLVILRGKLSVENACKALYQAALGLQAAHDAGVIHRDIKPSNLFVTKDGKLKILDLGLARLSQDDGEGLTKSGQVFGTPEYMAPEQWDDVHGCDGRTDLYALGCTLCFLLTGEPPYGGEEYKTAPRKMLGHINDPIPSLIQRRPDVPAELEAIYVKLMAKSADHRFASAKELAEALSPWVLDESKLTQLPLSAPNMAKKPSAATVPDKTHISVSQLPLNSAATGSAVVRQDLGAPTLDDAPTLIDPLSKTGVTQHVVAEPAPQRSTRARAWTLAGGLLLTALVIGSAIYFRRPPLDVPPPPIPSPPAEPGTPDLADVTVLPDEFLNLLLPSRRNSHDRATVSRPWLPEPPAQPISESPFVMANRDEATGMPVGEEVVLTTALLPVEPLVPRTPAGEFPEPDEIAMGPRPLSAPFNTEKIKVAQAEWAAERSLPADRLEISNSLGMALVFIPPGEFDMGSSSQLRRVKIEHTLYVGKYEVTQGEYKAVTGKNPSRFSPTGPKLFQPKIKGLKTDRLPVDSVTWEEAIDFCNQLSAKEGFAPYYSGARKVLDPEADGYRLLTEAEWEYVCRAGTDTLFSFGQALSTEQANIKDTQKAGSALGRTQEVGRYAANQFGLHDLHGNVMEWCFDTVTVKGAAKYRALRGGSWNRTAKDSSAYDRALLEPGQNQNDSGFRVARTVRAVIKP